MHRIILLVVVILFSALLFANSFDLFQSRPSRIQLRLEYAFKEKSQREITINSHIIREVPKNESENQKVHDMQEIVFDEEVKSVTRSRSTPTLNFKRIKHSERSGNIEIIKADTSVELPSNANTEEKILHSLIGKGIEYDVGTNGRIGNIQNSEELSKSVVEKLYGTDRRNDETEEAYKYLGNNWADNNWTDILENIYIELSNSRVREGSRWRGRFAKSIYKIGEISFDIEFSLDNFDEVDKTIIAKIKYSGETDGRSRANKIESNVQLDSAKIEGTFVFDASQGRAVKSSSKISIEYKQRIIPNDADFKWVTLTYEKNVEVNIEDTYIPADKPRIFNDSEFELPKPSQKGNMTLEETLSNRRSVREYKNTPISLEELSQILWAAQGITNNRGYRTAPSAGATFPLEIYVVVGSVSGINSGIYKYLNKEHRIKRIIEGDKRADLATAAVNQNSVRTAPVSIVISAVYARTRGRYRERAERYVHIEVGHCAQNILLQVEALKLAAVPVGSFTDDRVKELCGLADDESPLYIIPIGKR